MVSLSATLMSPVKTAEPIAQIDESGGPNEAQVQSYSPAGASERAHWRHLASTIELSVCGGDAASCQIIVTTCYYYYY